MREVALALACCAVVLSGCTIRYSQAVVGRVALVKPSAIQNSDAGTEIGVGVFAAAPAVVTFSEPLAAHEMAQKVPCEAGLTQVDYRGTFYAFYLAANFPEVELRSYCPQ